MAHDRNLRQWVFAISLICHLVVSAAWTIAFDPTLSFTTSSFRLANSRSQDGEISSSGERSSGVNATDSGNEAITVDVPANSIRSAAPNSLPTYQYSSQARQREGYYGERSSSGYKSRRRRVPQPSWNIDQQQQVYATITDLLQQEGPALPSEIISASDIAASKELIQASGLSQIEPDPSSDYDDELYRAVFSQEPDYFILKEKDEEYRNQEKRQYKDPSPERLRQIEQQNERKEANRLKLVQRMADFLQELKSEETQSSRQKCRKCKCIMTPHSAASQGQLCQVCYVDSLATAAKNEPVKQRRQYITNPNLRSYNPPMEQEARPRPRRPMGDGKVMAFGDLINGALENANSKEEETNTNAVAEESNPKESSSSPWCEMTDPDTGKIFYWNEETEDMRWEI